MVERDLFDDLEVLVRLERAAVDANEEAHLDELESFFRRACVRVDDAAESLAVRFESGDKVGVAVARVEEEREVVLRG